MAGSISLKEFGFNFCGPLIWSYSQKVAKYLEEYDCNVYCLAREGFLFKQALEAAAPNSFPVYLYASRTFLFRITLYNPDSWEYSLTHSFTGPLVDFFVLRFGFTKGEIELMLGDIDEEKIISLPQEVESIKLLLSENLDIIKEITKQSRASYLDYLKSVGIVGKEAKPTLFLDIGYSGTIQKLLTLLIKRNTTGFYFITTNSSNNKVNNLVAEQHFAFKDNVKMGDGYELLDRSMFLESLFTSPDGQFIDIRSNEFENEVFDFYFGKRGYTQQYFEKLNLIFEGTIDAVRHFRKHKITFDTIELETLYSKYVFHKNLIPSEAWALFEFDDGISGHGNVSPINFFGL